MNVVDLEFYNDFDMSQIKRVYLLLTLTQKWFVLGKDIQLKVVGFVAVKGSFK